MNRSWKGPPSRGDAQHRRIRIRVVVAAIALLLIVGGGVVAFFAQGSPNPVAEPTDDPYARPSGWDAYRPSIHLTPPDRWMNDPQRPFWLNGRWHYYYLYNGDYPDGNGTEWFHVTSTDLVHWTDEGVAITKYTNGLGDIETGSAIVDADGRAGFGVGAVIAILTQQDDGVQRQSLWVSADGGYSFQSFDENPVLQNPGVPDFRDPKIFWDTEREHWVMVLAEGDKLGFYTSSDLKVWTYRSGLVLDDLGTLECPDLFPMSVDGDSADVKWVLMAGADGSAFGMSTGTAYWIGEWDGAVFTADTEEPEWLDYGSDFYATVTWDDPRLDPQERLDHRFAIGWLNNWAYARDLPADQWSGGSDSVVRDIALRTSDDGRIRLVSVPSESLNGLEGASVAEMDSLTVASGTTRQLADPGAVAYRLRIEIASPSAAEARIDVKVGGGSFATVGVDFSAQRVFVARDADSEADALPDVYGEIRSAPVSLRADGSVLLDVIVDTTSVEVFVNDGEVALSRVIYGHDGANAVQIEAVDGSVDVRRVSIIPLAVAVVERQ